MKIAAVDIGTNTVRLLLGDVVGDVGHLGLDTLERHEIITKLGEGLDASGRLAESAMGRVLTGLSNYADLIADFGAERMGGVATAATRSAENGEEFAALMADLLGFHPRVIDGVEEARLTFMGATSGREDAQSFGVIDVGGGSTEFVIGRHLPDYAMSVDVGSVLMTERFKARGISEVAAQRDYVASLLTGVAPPYAPAIVLGSGGTFVTLGAVHGGLSKAEAESRDDLVLSMAGLSATVDTLHSMSVSEIADLPGVVPARAGVLQAGAVCAERAVAHLGVDQITISVADILDGLALHLVEEELSS
jgi:exopolyphosphatase/guanosine-5'-triphosphate,3'-diphosphate pyrophosphatase